MDSEFGFVDVGAQALCAASDLAGSRTRDDDLEGGLEIARVVLNSFRQGIEQKPRVVALIGAVERHSDGDANLDFGVLGFGAPSAFASTRAPSGRGAGGADGDGGSCGNLRARCGLLSGHSAAGGPGGNQAHVGACALRLGDGHTGQVGYVNEFVRLRLLEVQPCRSDVDVARAGRCGLLAC